VYIHPTTFIKDFDIKFWQNWLSDFGVESCRLTGTPILPPHYGFSLCTSWKQWIFLCGNNVVCFRMLFRDLLHKKIGAGRSERTAQHQDAGRGKYKIRTWAPHAPCTQCRDTHFKFANRLGVPQLVWTALDRRFHTFVTWYHDIRCAMFRFVLRHTCYQPFLLYLSLLSLELQTRRNKRRNRK
jgi:hypothetical protein